MSDQKPETRPGHQPGIARMIDANLNRAAEGLRLLEDVARFIGEDAALAERCKGARHAVRAAGADLLGRSVPSRDAEGDVGRTIKAVDEGSRRSMRDCVAASAKRAAEALRVLEEAAKVPGGMGGANWGTFERVRYAVYDMETAALALLPERRAAVMRLCVLLTESICTMPWDEVAAAAIEGGADGLQLREKSLEGGELLARARALVRIAAGRAMVIINDRPDIAVLSGADGVHVGQGDLPIEAARRIVGDSMVIGVSTSRIEEARAAIGLGADYLGLGPMFASSTKSKPTLAGTEYLRTFLADPGCCSVPHLAISGIDAGRAAALAGLGCLGVAVSGAVCGAADPRAATAAIRDAMARGR